MDASKVAAELVRKLTEAARACALRVWTLPLEKPTEPETGEAPVQ